MSNSIIVKHSKILAELIFVIKIKNAGLLEERTAGNCLQSVLAWNSISGSKIAKSL